MTVDPPPTASVAAEPRLLSLEEARSLMLAGVLPLPAEEVDLASAAGRVCAEPVASRVTLPPFDNSAMDGFAVRAADVADASGAAPRALHVVGEVAAGHPPPDRVVPGTALRVLTGGMIPDGADGVVPVEDTDAPAGLSDLPDLVHVSRPAAGGAHIRRRGSDLQAGDPVVAAGTVIRPATVALLAATGHAEVRVHRRPRVAILGTGDELVAPGQPLAPGRIHDSNSIALGAQAGAAGAAVRLLGIAPDDLEAVQDRVHTGVGWADVLIVSGGVSVGAHDVVKAAFETVGRIELWRVAIQPGKPLAFGRAQRPDGSGVALLFGLPGNPVSSFVTFELFVRPVLRRLGGHDDAVGRRVERATLTGRATTSAGRRAFLRVRLRPDPQRAGAWLADLAGGQGSHVLSALAQSDALAVVPEEIVVVEPGTELDVWRLDEGPC